MYNVIDLFSGCGGISKGFDMTGRVHIVGAIDFEAAACKTYKSNFKDANVLCGDINKITVEETEFKDIDIIVGGPPCQGFSGLNRWEKDKDNDPRNKLFLQFLRFVDKLRPKAILIENVKQILTSKNGYVPKHITNFMEERGYNVSYSILKASDFGVPQKRERAFFVAIKKEYGKFSFDNMKNYYKKTVTVGEAISDIWEIEMESKKLAEGTVVVLNSTNSEYQKLMQRSDMQLFNHFIYYPAEIVQERMKYVKQGENWKSVPCEMFRSQRDNRHSNYLKRLKEDDVSITIDTNHNVYFHPRFNRVPTVREAARIQSFPDNFIFTGLKGQQFKQVGNAVPPLLAKALANAIIDTLEGKYRYRVLDLFSGAGGLSLGFEKKYFEVVKAIDFDDNAIKTYNLNRTAKVGEVKDIKEIDDEFIKGLGNIDGIIGGPPCQGFSTAGQRIIDDERNRLYREYFRVLESVSPKFFLIENVKGILNFANGAIVSDIKRRADLLGYNLFYETLSADEYGVPQVRKRVIFIGIKKELVYEPFTFPKGVEDKVSILDAIGDLPSLDRGEDNTTYNIAPFSEYQKYIRNGSVRLYNHEQSRHTEDVKNTVALIPEGKRVRDLPEELRGNRNYCALMRKMDRNKPSLCIDTGHRTYFHYEEMRVPSVRECARLQSFPDTYVFYGPKQAQYRQVGNAVPPLLAEKMANAIFNYLSKNNEANKVNKDGEIIEQLSLY